MKTHKRDFTFLPELIISDRGGKLRNGICCCMQVFNIFLKSQLWEKKKSNLTKIIISTDFVCEISFKTFKFILN